MLVLQSKITITQAAARDKYPDRTRTFSFDFVRDVEINRSWENLTDTAKITFPKKVKFRDQYKDFGWEDKTIYQPDKKNSPLLMRGDQVKIELGYKYRDAKTRKRVVDLATEFEGFISSVGPNGDLVEIMCEDYMWQLKQVKTPNKTFKGSEYDIQKMIDELLEHAGLKNKHGLSVNNKPTGGTAVSTKMGDFILTGAETIADVLLKLKNDYHLVSFFRRKELRCAGFSYYPQDREEKNLTIGWNVITPDVKYTRQDDLNIGLLLQSISTEELPSTNRDGTQKKKKKRVEVFITKDGKANKDLFQGQIETRFLWNCKTEAELIEQGAKLFNSISYEGLRGTLEIFGLPRFKHGDAVVLGDNLGKDRAGKYLVKAVKKYFGINGFRQELTPHVRIDRLNNSDLVNGF